MRSHARPSGALLAATLGILLGLACAAAAVPVVAQSPSPPSPPADGPQAYVPLVSAWYAPHSPAASAEIAYSAGYATVAVGLHEYPLYTLRLTNRAGMPDVPLIPDLIPAIARYASDHAWSPDGEHLVFSMSAADDPSVADLYVRRLADGETVRLTSGPEFESWPAYSPGGEQIAYVDVRGETRRLMAIDATGAARHIVTAQHPLMPAWSPDGEWIAYVDAEDLDGTLCVVRAAGGDPLRLAEHVALQRPAWSPDGRGLAYAGEPSEQSDAPIDPASGLRLDLVAVPGVHPAWSPTGGWIVYAVIVGEAPGIWIVRPGGGGTLQITHPCSDDEATCVDDQPAWSPDGRYVAFRRTTEPATYLGPQRRPPESAVLVTELGSSAEWRVSHKEIRMAAGPLWRPPRR